MIQSFPPIISEDSKVLILGTMPGNESLRKEQYYAHVKNLFWPMLYSIFGQAVDEKYEQKVRFLKEKQIALWDIYQCCEREGSLDSQIKNEVLNDVAGLLHRYPNIRYVFLNGEKAGKQFKKEIMPRLERRVYPMQLFSSSPANASISMDKKKQGWQSIKYTLKNRVLHCSVANTPVGPVTIYSNNCAVTAVLLPPEERRDMEGYAVFPEDEIAQTAKVQIIEYFNGTRREFDVPVQIAGTFFQREVYTALQKVPYGTTVSYGELAERAGNSKAARAIGQALRRNPVPILIPCHRVVGSNRKNIGFMGLKDNPLQSILLNVEKNNR